ncbi:SGNH/GDSL hydrolase family protein [Saccharopolyspora sp. 5N102]|uniref:SGNH/GDSL hydrolase family protein n=1 Tax=Saccharopolyspora sp. 5N102 TaxID=3375155 RepID=UPI003791A58D
MSTLKSRKGRRRAVVLASSLTLGALIAGFAALMYAAFLRAPENSPADFLERGRAAGTKQLVVAAGSSSTKATLSADWLASLRNRFGPQGYEFVNAGANGDTSADLLARLDSDVIACRPDAIVLLIGGNDARDQVPPDEFRTNLTAVVDRLRAGTNARIALLSLPPQGEDLSSAANQALASYNDVIKQVANVRGATYLPLNERFAELLRERSPNTGEFGFGGSLLVAFERYALGRTWNEISAGNGLRLLTDHLHLNDDAAAEVTGLVAGWLNA